MEFYRVKLEGKFENIIEAETPAKAKRQFTDNIVVEKMTAKEVFEYGRTANAQMQQE